MNQKDDFFIGYLPKAPKSYQKRTVTFVIFAMLLMITITIIVVLSQRGFASSTFEYGQLTKVEGLISLEPIPNIKALYGQDENNQPIFQTIPLIGFGKFGAESTLEKIRPTLKNGFEKTVVTLEGTLIHRDGKALLELTNNENSLVAQSNDLGVFQNMTPKIEMIGQKALRGEIVDPKCFFGIMKPGHSKPHRSCAIRCISGGIPPFLWIEFENGTNDFYILRGEKGEIINQDILSYVGDKIELTGNVEIYDDWKMLFINPANIERLR